MKKVFTILVPMAIGILLTVSVFAHSPQKMSYQAVIRNSSNALVINTPIGIKISIHQGSPTGTVVYSEIFNPNPVTNANGLVTVEIGAGIPITGTFANINWSSGPYFVKTETDPSGGTNYTITGTSQLLSVPYALHAKTAEIITETDPLWSASPSFGITNSNITSWNNAFGWGNHATAGYVSASRTLSINGTSFDLSANRSWNVGTVTSIATGNGITGGPITTTGTLGLTGQALALHNLSTDGIIARTGAGTVAARSIAVSGNGINIANGNGVSGNPTVSLNIGTGATQVAAGNHSHGNITTDGKIGTAAGRIITTATDGTMQATAGTATGQMLYWNGTAWVNVPAGNSGQVLTLVNGVPTWTGTSAGSTDVVNPSTGKIWMDRNLGATQVATSSTDANAYGHLYQWGRATDGHQLRTSGTTTTLSSDNTPGHGNFITVSTHPYDWRSPQNDNLWQGVSGVNNPCPSGYRLPTEAEWIAERASWSSNNSAGAFASPLKLPLAGSRSYSAGSLSDVGSAGTYWSCTVDGIFSRYLVFLSNNAGMYGFYRAIGRSVRCLKD